MSRFFPFVPTLNKFKRIFTFVILLRNLIDYAEQQEDRIKSLNLDDTNDDDVARKAKFLEALLLSN